MASAASSGIERVGILPLRNSVLFPASVVPINVGRPRSVRLVEELADEPSHIVGILTQRNAETIEPTFADMYEVGTLARVVKLIRLGPSNYSVVLNGLGRFRVTRPGSVEPFIQADVVRLEDIQRSPEVVRQLTEELREAARQLVSGVPAPPGTPATTPLPREVLGILDNVSDSSSLADLIASNLSEEQAPVEVRQQLLEAIDLEERIRLLLELVRRHLDVARVKDEISSLVQQEMSRSQRDYVLRQQLRDIREELGEAGEDDELEQLRERIALAEMPDEARATARKQLSRLTGMQPQAAEYQVTRSYVEWLADLPWSRTTPDTFDVRMVRQCLDEDHWGLEPVKKRIVEYAAIRQLRRDKRGPILLFVGPPGVGKTSLGRSIARAMGRRYGRISLGGVRDEAEIRGHRRTYVGALPGRIIQALKKVGTRNPVLVLDEVDKMGVDLRGDPAAALLEVLDPAQNDSFVDHYIDLPFDLSEVIFLATANDHDGIPGALEDRMELIEVPGYTRSDKRNIARQFLVPKQLDQHGLTKDQLEFLPEGIDTLIDFYTREAGVRGLEREVAAVARHATVRIAEGQSVQGERVDRAHVENVLGTHRYRPEVAERQLRPGVSTGLGTSDSGGELLIVEATRMPGTGDIRLTGNLRNVMTEAAQTAVSLVRSRSERLGLDTNWIEKVDLHVHIPRARAVRDAAGAGLPIFVAIISLLYGAPTRSDVALVGEVTLRGRVLPVSHLKDQVLAAHRADVRQVVIPSRNQRDLEEVPREILDEIQVHLVDRVEDALQWVLISPPLQDLKSSDTVASDDTGGPGHLEDRAEPNAESEPPRSGGSVASVATRCKAP